MAELNLEAFTAALREVTGTDDIDLDCPLANLKLDSLALVEWLYTVEEDYGLEVDQDVIVQLPDLSIRNVFDLVSSAAAS